MKRKPIIFAVALLLVVGASLWGVNYRLNNPPLNSEDARFLAAIQGADRVEAWQASCDKSGCLKPKLTTTRLNAAQTRELVRHLRFIESDGIGQITGKHPYYEANFTFLHGSHKLLQTTLASSGGHSFFYASTPASKNYKLNPRFEKSLQNYLSRVLPPRVDLLA